MKKLILTTIILSSALPAFCILPPDAAIIQVHDMQMIKQQRFRYEELNDYNEVQEEKARFEKRNEPTKTFMEKIFNKKSKFVEDNGEIKIEYQN